LLQQRQELNPDLAGKWSRWAQMHFLGSHGYLQSSRIALYAGIDREIGTQLIFERARAAKKTLFFPHITGPGEMVFLETDDCENMVPNRYGIPEPVLGSREIAVEDLDLVVVPGVAFDREGFRLGFGGGYYDRVLPRLRPEAISLGLAYTFQVVDKLPTRAHDRKVKRLVTEQGFLRLSPEGD
jgi:5-formyltetrahydrofolate cyclo-ligase